MGGSRARLVSPVVVGRDIELARLCTAVAQPPAVLLVHGEAGVGKTGLLTELLGRVDVADGRKLVGRCDQARWDRPSASRNAERLQARSRRAPSRRLPAH